MAGQQRELYIQGDDCDPFLDYDAARSYFEKAMSAGSMAVGGSEKNAQPEMTHQASYVSTGNIATEVDITPRIGTPYAGAHNFREVRL